MLERAARAHWDAKRYSTSRAWDDLPQSERTKAIRHTAAALQAIREPSEAMKDAGYRAMMHTDFTGPQETACWRAMIDTIVKDAASWS